MDAGPPRWFAPYTHDRTGGRRVRPIADGRMTVPGTAATLASALARHAPAGGSDDLGEGPLRDLATAGSTSVRAVVVVGDLRLSGLLLREALNPTLYARFVVGFTEAVRSLANASGGWFDKFTGDGFVVFWLYPDEGRVPTETVPGFCQEVLPASDALVANLRRNSRNFPVGVGLALGLDSGPCELVRVGESITIVGSPIVGATRMAAGARAGETVVNVQLGGAFERNADQLGTSGIVLERTVLATKEYPDGQEAYRMRFGLGSSKSPT